MAFAKHCIAWMFICSFFQLSAQKKKTVGEVENVSLELNQGFIHGGLGFEISPDDKKVVVWSKSNLLKIYSIKTGELLRTLSGNSFILCATYNPYNGNLFSFDMNKELIEWDTLGKPIRRTIINKPEIEIRLEEYGQYQFGLLFMSGGKSLFLFDYYQSQYPVDLINKKEYRLNSLFDALVEAKCIPDTLYDLAVMDLMLFPHIAKKTPQELLTFPKVEIKENALKETYKFKYMEQTLFSAYLFYKKNWHSSGYVLPATTNAAFENRDRKYYSISTGSTFSNLLFFDEKNNLYQNINLLKNIEFPLINNDINNPSLAIVNDSSIHVVNLANMHIAKTHTFKHGHYSDYIPAFDTSGNYLLFPFIRQRYLNNVDPVTCNCEHVGLWDNSPVRYGSIWNFKENTFSDSIPKRNFVPQCGINCSNIPNTAAVKKMYGEYPQDKYTREGGLSAIDGGVASQIGGMIEVYWAMNKSFPVNDQKEYLTFDLKSKLYLLNINNGNLKKEFINEVIPIYNAFVPKTNFIFTLGADGVLRFFDLKSKSKTAFARIVTSDKGLLFLTEDRYYMMSGQLSDQIYFNVNNKNYPFEQFDIKFNRPDKVLQKFGCNDTLLMTSYHKAYLKRLKKLNFTEDMLKPDFHIPEITIANRHLLDNKTTDSVIKLELKCIDSKYNLDRINIWINDVPVYGVNGINLRDKNNASFVTVVNLQLAQGTNKIQVSALNQAGAESYKETFAVDYTPTVTKKPDLYVIAIGASKYNDARYNLTYASKDANDIRETFSKNTNGIYDRVYSYTLVDEAVTNENILKVKDHLAKATRNDVVLITVAGHGVLDPDLNYYLATYDMDFNNPSQKGLPYESLENLLDGIAPLKKILLLDACHSGEVDKEEIEQLAVVSTGSSEVKFRSAGAGIQKKTMGLKSTSELMSELFTDLRKGTGTTIISSSGGAEYSMESDAWKNGLFTYCLLNGLQSKTCDSNGDGTIMLSELQQYLRKEVVLLSGGKQQPTSRMQNISMDFPVW